MEELQEMWEAIMEATVFGMGHGHICEDKTGLSKARRLAIVGIESLYNFFFFFFWGRKSPSHGDKHKKKKIYTGKGLGGNLSGAQGFTNFNPPVNAILKHGWKLKESKPQNCTWVLDILKLIHIWDVGLISWWDNLPKSHLGSVSQGPLAVWVRLAISSCKKIRTVKCFFIS